MPASGLVMGRDLLPAPLPALAVYVHIPFCSSRCRYCDFYFETGWSERVLTRTLERILEEARFFMNAMGQPEVRTIYFGGGTPSVIPPRLLDSFLARLRTILVPRAAGPNPVEWSFEANPEGITRELLVTLRRHGVDRLSLGVQSFDDALLRFLTRRATRSVELAALETIAALCGEEAFSHLNVDIMTGIPGQRAGMVEADIDVALRYAPDHFSVYSLTVEERTPLAQMIAHGQARASSPQAHERLWFAARERLARAGYDHYEVSNFALPGARSRHNRAYWRLDPYIGLGPGGASTVPVVWTSAAAARAPGAGTPRAALGAGPGAEPRDEPGARSVARLKNPNLFAYSSAFDPAMQHEVELLSARDFLIEHFLTGLRTSEGVRLARIREIFGLELKVIWGERFDRWRADGKIDAELLAAPDPALCLTERHRLLLDPFLVEIQEAVEGLGNFELLRWPPERY